MEILNFKHYCIVESNDIKNVVSIDLNDEKSRIKIGLKYEFLGIEFNPFYDDSGINKESYIAIIQRPGIKSGTEMYWGKVIKAVDLSELKKEIRVEIKYYLEDNPIIESLLLENNNKYTFRLPIIITTGYSSIPKTVTRNTLDILKDGTNDEMIPSIIKKTKDSFNKAKLLQYMYTTNGDKDIVNPIKSILSIGELDKGLEIEVKTDRDLTKKEINTLKDYIHGQALDGWGEGFSQKDIEGFSIEFINGKDKIKQIK